MLDRFRIFLGVLLVLLAAGSSGCSCMPGVDIPAPYDGGMMEMPDAGPCGTDCSKVPTLPCKVAVCNTGQEIGPLNTCVVVPADKGASCDDGKFCTSNDTCDGNG